MAKIKLGSIVVDMRGKLGGQVYAKNRSGAYVRNKVTPVNPQTSFQAAARGILASFSEGWRNLTEAQRDAWRSAVDDYQSTNVFGDTVKPTGKNLYTKLNINLSDIGQGGINSPIAPAAIVEPSDLSLVADTGTEPFELSFSGADADQTYKVFATAPQSAGVNFFKNKYRLIGTHDGSSGGTIDLSTIYAAKFGSPGTGQKISVKLVPVVNSTGQAGVGSNATAIVTKT